MQGWGFAIVATIRRLACKAGRHEEVPEVIDRGTRHGLRADRRMPTYLLLGCTACHHTRSLLGAQADEWLERWHAHAR